MYPASQKREKEILFQELKGAFGQESLGQEGGERDESLNSTTKNVGEAGSGGADQRTIRSEDTPSYQRIPREKARKIKNHTMHAPNNSSTVQHSSGATETIILGPFLGQRGENAYEIGGAVEGAGSRNTRGLT